MGYCINEFVRIRPRHEIDQKQLLEWIAKLHAVAAQTAQLQQYACVEEKLLQVGYGSDKILSRGVQISDPYEPDFEKMQIYPVARQSEGVGFTERMHFFDREVSAIFEEFYPLEATLPQHLIHVTCTGYVAPSPAQKIVSKRNAQNSFVTHAYHMGCYASIPAIRMAVGSLAMPSPDSSVDIVHTEVCSLHMHPLRNSTEQLVVQSLFADGFIKYSVHKDLQSSSLRVCSLLQEIIPDSVEMMSWRCEDICHAMTLSKKVPVLIARALKDYFLRLVQKMQGDKEQIQRRAFFAIHPGGSKILEHVKQLFSLSDEQMAHTLDILRKFGNMSSATLPHIWQSMLEDESVPDGAFIVSLAFGPGLSITGGIFEKIGDS